MKRGFFVAMLAISLFAPSPLAAMIEELTPETAASEGFSVLVRSGKATANSPVHFRVARAEPSLDSNQKFTARLRIHRKSTPIAERIREHRSYWEIDIPAGSLPDAKFEIFQSISIPDGSRSFLHYEIKLSDFAPRSARSSGEAATAPQAE